MLTLELQHAEETTLYDILHKLRVKLYWSIWDKLPQDIRDDLDERSAIKMDGTGYEKNDADSLALWDLIGAPECPKALHMKSTPLRYRVVLRLEMRLAQAYWNKQEPQR